MPAAVEDRMDGAISVARDDDRGAAEHARNVVAGGRDLALVREKYPCPIEDPLDLEPIDLVADEDLTAHLAACDVNPALLHRCQRMIRHGKPPG